MVKNLQHLEIVKKCKICDKRILCQDGCRLGLDMHDSEIGVKELFPYYKEGTKPHSYARYCGSVHLTKLGNNDPYAYENAMEHLLISNYYDINRLILIRRKREGRPGWYSDEEYSILAIIDTGIGKNFGYYNEAGSYSSEGSYYVIKLLEKMKSLGVSYSEKLFSNGESMDEILLDIIKEFE